MTNIAIVSGARGGDGNNGGGSGSSGVGGGAGGGAASASERYLFGWAWGSTSEAGSPGVGWIKFNSCDDNNRDGLPDGNCIPTYGVKVDTNNGKVSGYAWSNNIGWVSFNRSDTGAPPSDDPGSNVIAKFNRTKGDFDGTISGWARVLSGMDSPTDGWDGWIHLADTSSNPSRHPTGYNDGSKGVTYNKSAGTIVGYGWGSVALGWINFFNVTFGANNSPFDYTLSNSGNIQVVAGGSGQVSVVRNYVSGISQPVTLNITSPSIIGVTPVIGTNPCTPFCSSNITFNVAANTLPQTYNIVVKGNPNGLNGEERATSFNLTVKAPDTGGLNISCLVESNPPYLINKKVKWKAMVTGAELGTPPYTADWTFTGDNEAESTGHSNASASPIEIEKIYSKVGLKRVVATVTDSTGLLSGTCSTSVPINVVVEPNITHF